MTTPDSGTGTGTGAYEQAPAVRTAGPNDIDVVTDLITDAFDHLEVIAWLVPDPTPRRTIARDWFALHVEHAIGGAGQVVATEDATTGEITAAAVWFDRTGPALEPEHYPRRLASITGDHLTRFQTLDQHMDAHHPTPPHWHLLFLAVHPHQQRRGLGSLLLDHTHHRLDTTHTAAYLEATGTDNQRLYHRHHYLDRQPAIDLTDSLTLLPMWRPAQRLPNHLPQPKPNRRGPATHPAP